MKARELRIGNYVDIYGSTSKVVPTDFDPNHINQWVTVENYEYVIKSWKPVLITEEWLNKFGFEKLWHINHYEYYNMIDDYCCIYFSNYDKKFHCTLGLEQDNIDENIDLSRFHVERSINIQYVHQLQNLYFALTGKELEIK